MVISFYPSFNYINVQYIIALSAGSTNITDAQLSHMEIFKSDFCSKVYRYIYFKKCFHGSQLYRTVAYAPIIIPSSSKSVWFFPLPKDTNGVMFPSLLFVFIFILEII